MTTEVPIKTPLTIARLPISSAFTWYNNGLTLLKAQPWSLFLTVSWAMLISLMASEIPQMLLPQVAGLGLVLSTIIGPILAFGMADVAQKIRLQHRVNPLDVFSGLHPNHRGRLFRLGLLIALVPAAISIILQHTDTTQFASAINTLQADNSIITPENIEEKQKQIRALFIDNPTVMHTITVFYGLMLSFFLVLLLTAYAPLFIVWQNASAPRALLLSVSTVLKNILPLLMLVILTTFTAFGILALLGLLVGLLSAIQPLAAGLGLALFFLFTAFIYALIFASYHNIVITSLANSIKNQIKDKLDQNEL